MDWSDVGEQILEIGKSVPGGLKLVGSIMTASGVGAPVGAAMTAVGTLLANALSTPSSTVSVDPASIQAAIAADPTAPTKIAQIEADHQVALQQLIMQQAISDSQNETAQQSAILTDKQNARTHDSAIIALGKLNIRADLMLAGAYITLIVSIVVMCILQVIKPEVMTLITVIATQATKNIATAFDFEYGSSRSSVEKTAVIAQQAQANSAS